MATISKLQRPTGAVYRARVRKSGQPAVTKTFKHRSDAEKWARQTEAAIERDDSGLTNEAQRHTLADALTKYRDERLGELTADTAEAYDAHLRFWGDSLGHLRLSELRPERIAQQRDKLRTEGRSPATCNRYLNTLAAVLTRCVKHWHWLQVNPVSQVAKLTEHNTRKRFLSKPELGRLLEACRASKSPDLLAVVLLAIGTGARRGEILGLRWCDLDLSAGLMAARATTENDVKGSIRTLPIPAAALPLLTERKAAADAATVVPLRDERLVFPSNVSQRRPIVIRQSWETAVRAANLGDFHFHDLRHSAASFMAANGASLREIGEVLGHRAAQTTQRYAHLAETHAQTVLRGMSDELLGTAGGSE
ncbi:MAG: site-specific integrase [Thiohalocapsa sp.]